MNIRLSYALEDFAFEYDTDSLFTLQSSIHTLTFDNDTTTPALPQIPVTVAVAPGKSYLDFTLGFSESPVLQGRIPARNEMCVPTSESGIEYTNVIPDYAPQSFPDERIVFTGSDSVEGISMLHFLVSPFRYDAQTRTLYLNSDLRINIRLMDSDMSGTEMPQLPDHLRELISGLCVNSSDIEMLRTPAQIQNEDITGDLDYVIITSRQLAPAFEPLKRWKTIKGVRTEIKCVEDIYREYTGKDSQERIKLFLHESFKNRGLKYVLLGGDHMNVPVRGCYGAVQGGTGFKEDKIMPTDLYYACFGGTFDWDGNGNGIYGETSDDVSWTPSIFVSRVPAKSTADVENFVNKTLSYEFDPTKGKTEQTMLLTGAELSHSCRIHPFKYDSQCELELLYKLSIAPYSSIKATSLFDKALDFLNIDPLNASRLAQELSKGYSFVSVNCHGSTTSWLVNKDKYLSFKVDSVKFINNPYWSVITTSACETSWFDGYTPCLGASLLFSPTSGVINYLGSSRYGWSSPTIHSLGPSLEYEKGFYTSLLKSKKPFESYAVLTALSKMMFNSKSTISDAHRWLQYSLNPFGDPETPIFNTIPQTMPEIGIEKRENGIRVNVNGKQSTVAVMSSDDDGKSFYRVVKCSGEYDFECGDTDVTVCVQRPGYIPYVVEVKADCLYIQNETFEGDHEINRKRVVIGSNVTSEKKTGKVVFKNGKTVINAERVELRPGTKIESGTVFKIKPIKK